VSRAPWSDALSIELPTLETRIQTVTGLPRTELRSLARVDHTHSGVVFLHDVRGRGDPMRPKASVLVLSALILLVPGIAHAAPVGWVDEFGSSESDIAWGIAVQGTDVYVDGWTSGELPGQTSAGLGDGYVRRIDAAGNEVWTRQFGTSAEEFIVALAVDATGVYATGSTDGVPGQTGVEVAAVPSSTTSWQRAGPSVRDRPRRLPVDVVVDATSAYVVGNTYGTFRGDEQATRTSS
jgi:hypothetical protein